MIAALAKLMSIGLVGYCCVNSIQKSSEPIEKIINLPRRMMTIFELKQIHRLIQYDLVDGSDRVIVLSKFCQEELTARGRDPGTDYWKTPYRLYFESRLYHEDASATLSYNDAEKYIVVSAGIDKKYMSMDDLTSKSDADEEVRELTEKIEKMAKKLEKK